MSDDFGYLRLSDKVKEIVKFEIDLAEKLKDGRKKLEFGDPEVIRYNYRTAHVYEIGDEETVNYLFGFERSGNEVLRRYL